MKDSGIDWIGEIPEDWSISRLKYISNLRTGNSLNENQKKLYESIDDNDISYISTNNIDVSNNHVEYKTGLRIPRSENKFTLAPKNSVLLCVEGGSAGRKVTFIDREVFYVNKLCNIISKYNTKYIYYYLQSNIFKDEFNLNISGLIGGVSTGKLKNFFIPDMSIDEQKKIADYLDDKTKKIDSLIENIKKKIELLGEQRSALINQVVTKGLDPNVEMKDSGIDWIGEIPKHWDIVRISYLYNEKSVKGFENEQMLSVMRDFGVVRRDDFINHNVIPEDLSNYKLVEVNDLVLNKMKTWMGSLGVSRYYGIVSPAYYTFTPNHNHINEYLNHLFRSFIYINIYASLSKGIRPDQWDLPVDKFKILKIPIPPRSEQKTIADYLDKKLNKIYFLIENNKKKIELLEEQRTSLISNLVTGKIRVS